MNLSDLSHDEQTALVALILELIRIDGVTSEEELEELRALGVEMGPLPFDRAYTRARDALGSREATLEFARSSAIRPEARELIHTVVSDMASSDGIRPEERALLQAVRAMWEISTIER